MIVTVAPTAIAFGNDEELIEKYKSAQAETDTNLEKMKTAFDALRTKYDAAISEYETCIGK